MSSNCFRLPLLSSNLSLPGSLAPPSQRKLTPSIYPEQKVEHTFTGIRSVLLFPSDHRAGVRPTSLRPKLPCVFWGHEVKAIF